jgi:hypothetical protein
MRRQKNAASGKSANDKRNYSKEEKEEWSRVVGIRGKALLTIDLATENGTGAQDVVLRLGLGLNRLLLEDMDHAGPVPVSIIEMTIVAGHSHLYFVFEVSSRAYNPITKHCIFSYLIYQYIWPTEITGYRFTGKETNGRELWHSRTCAREVRSDASKSSGEGLDRTLRIYGFQEYQCKKRDRFKVSAARGGSWR